MFRTSLALIALVGFATTSYAAQTPRAQAPAVAAAKSPSKEVININTATAADLERLPGIGAKTAGRIVEYRQKNGPFKKVEELMNIRGVGEKNFLRLRTQISVSAPKADRGSAQPQ